MGYKEAQLAVKNNDPPVEVNQFWISKNADDKILRRLRILAPHPDNDGMDRTWIFQEMPSLMHRGVSVDLRMCPEFNLRYVFTLENSDE